MTVRLDPDEAQLWRETLEELRRVLMEAGRWTAERPSEETREGGRIGFRYDERQQLERLLNQLELVPPSPEGRTEVIAPTPLVHEVAHASTREAIERVRLAIGEDITRPFRPTELERSLLVRRGWQRRPRTPPDSA
jgi:hypothetical protein